MNNQKPNNMIPIDLVSKIAMVKPTDGKGATVQTSTFRTIGQPAQMRVVMPAGPNSSGAAPIIQTHLLPLSHVIKQVDGAGVRTQITALPSTARTLSQTSITVTRSPTPNTFVQRGPTPVANLGPRGAAMSAPIRAPTPPSSTAINNITPNFVRGPMPGRTPSPAGSTILSPGPNWMTSGSPPVQLIRASISQSPRGRVPASSATNNNNNATTIVSSQPQQQSQQQQSVTSQQQQSQQPQQTTYVATLSTVMPPRQQTTTLIYSNVTNPQQQFTTVPNQRLAVATPLLGQRQVRPIQINSARLATTGVRVSSASLNIRGPTTIQSINTGNLLNVNALQGRATTVNATNMATTGMPARIIQVQQQPQSGGTTSAQVNRISGNLMTLHPVIMNTSATTSGGRQATTAKVQPSLTITHVNKLNTSGTGSGGVGGSQQQQQVQTTLTQQSGGQQIQLQNTSGGPIGIVTSGGSQHPTQIQSGGGGGQQQHQITQIVGLNQAGGHQIQIIGGSNIPVSGTVVPLTITSRGSVAASSGGSSAASSATQIVRNINSSSAITTTTVLPIAKVLPQPQSVAELVQHQQQHQQQAQPIQVVAATAAAVTGSLNLAQQAASQSQQPQSVFLHTRSPNPAAGTVTSSVAAAVATTFMQTPTSFYYEPISTMSSSSNNASSSTSGTVLSLSTTNPSASGVNNVTLSNVSSIPSTTGGGLAASVSTSYAPVSINNSSFAVVATTNTNRGGTPQIQPIPQQQQLSSVNGQTNITPLPVRFNPHLLVDNAQHQLLMSHQTSQQQQQPSQSNIQTINSSNTHHIITMQTNATNVVPPRSSTTEGTTNTTMLIPMSNAKVAATLANLPPSSTSSATSTVVTTSPRSNVTRKRDNEGNQKSAVKNLGPTLSQMSGPTAGQSSTNNNSTGNNLPPGVILAASGMILDKQLNRDRMTSSPVSQVDSSDGSTTVSATSSPGVDLQEEREHVPMNECGIPEMAFKSVEDLYHTQQAQQKQQQQQQQQQMHQAMQQHQSTNPAQQINFVSKSSSSGAAQKTTTSSSENAKYHPQHSTTSNSSNGNIDEATPRKKSRKQNINYRNEHASTNNNTSKKCVAAAATAAAAAATAAADQSGAYSSDTNKGSTQQQHVRSNKENSKPQAEPNIKRPRNITLLEGYKQTWKAANNHFQRYSDVKPREERPPTVMDMANQAHVMQKVNGWKIHHLTSQMEDLSEVETQVCDKLANMLKIMEKHEQSTEVDRVNELIKGNMQRSKIVSEGINDARNQILKVFDHKPHVSDIIQRCASKRNFKKRFKQLF